MIVTVVDDDHNAQDNESNTGEQPYQFPEKDGDVTVLSGAFAVGHVSGAVFNTAVAVGAMLMRMLDWQALWLYAAANLLGGAAAALVFNGLHPEDR